MPLKAKRCVMLRGGTQVARESASRFITWMDFVGNFIITLLSVHGGEVGRFRRRRRPWMRLAGTEPCLV